MITRLLIIEFKIYRCGLCLSYEFSESYYLPTGADPEAISSSGTDEYDDDEEDSSARSNDAEDGGLI